MYPVVPLILIYTLESVPAPWALPVLTTTWYHVKYTAKITEMNIELRGEVGLYISLKQRYDICSLSC